MFIGREKELNALEKLYQSGKFEFVVIYGRRRVGKTALINHFIDDKKSIYFMGVRVFSSSVVGFKQKPIFHPTRQLWNMYFNLQKGNVLYLRLMNTLM